MDAVGSLAPKASGCLPLLLILSHVLFAEGYLAEILPHVLPLAPFRSIGAANLGSVLFRASPGSSVVPNVTAASPGGSQAAKGVHRIASQASLPPGQASAALPSFPNGSIGAAAKTIDNSSELFLRYGNGSLQKFETCTMACDQCFTDHYQGCLAFCQIGCQEYCDVKLNHTECETRQVWIATVGNVFQALDVKARMCQATGLNGCPDRPTMKPTPVPYDPYTAAEQREDAKSPGQARLKQQSPGGTSKAGSRENHSNLQAEEDRSRAELTARPEDQQAAVAYNRFLHSRTYLRL